MTRTIVGSLLLAGLGLSFAMTAAAAEKSAHGKVESQQVQRGRYLVKIAGCNDCHTAGYAVNGGKVPEAQWLTGSKLGWRGSWGTTYAINLRLYMHDMTEAKWVQTAKTMQARPPMPWFILHDMTEQDVKAIYHYVKTLGPAGEPAPVYIPPGREPQQPYVLFPSGS